MTSANVSSMSMQVTGAGMTATKANDKDMPKQFMQLMSDSLNEISQSAETDVSPKNDVWKAQETKVAVKSKNSEIKSKEDVAYDEETVKMTEEAEETFAKEVRDALTEELGVSEEEIAEAMETLGLTFLDLTDKNNLAMLVTELTGVQDNISLLLDDSFMNVATQIDDLTKSLLKETGFSLEELKQMQNPKEMIPTETASTESVIPEEVKPETVTENMKPEELTKDTEVSEEASPIVETKEYKPTAEEKENRTSETKAETETDTTVETNDIAQKETTENNRSFLGNEKRQSAELLQNGEKQPLGNTLTPQNVNHFDATLGEISLHTGETVAVRDIVEQIVEAARTTITAKETTLEMMLNPEGLGKIFMEVSQRDGKVTAHIYTQDESVKQALEQQMVQLKDNLSQSAVKVNSIEVSVGTHEFEKNLEENQQQNQQEEQSRQQAKKTRILNRNQLDELSGLMSEEEELVAKIMRDNGNSVDYTA